MAVALPQTQAELDALKANLAGGYGYAASSIRNRDPQIQAAYDQIAAEIRGDAAKRAGADAETARQQDAGMASAAQALGVAPVSLPNSQARAVSNSLRDEYNGNASGWGTYLGQMKGHAVGRNDAAAASFDESGRVVQNDLQREFADYMASLAGSGGGGGGGRGGGGSGNYWEDEPLVEYGDIAPMTEGVVRGLAATSRRGTRQGEEYQKAKLLNPAGNQWKGPRTPSGAPSAGLSKSLLQRALANSKPKPAARGRGSGGTF